MRPLVVIDDEMLSAMLNDQRYRAIIPCLEVVSTKLKATKSRCRSCNQQVKDRRRELLEQARNCLREMPPPQRGELKRLLQTQRYRLRYRNAAGVLVVMTY